MAVTFTVAIRQHLPLSRARFKGLWRGSPDDARPPTLARAYFRCSTCRRGFCPLDRRWGLDPAHAIPTVQARATVLAAHIPYTRVPAFLAQLRL